MDKRPLLRLLLTPSIMSGLTVVAIVGIVLGYSGWLYIGHNFIFYNYLFGAYGLYTYVWQSTLGLSDGYQAFLGSSAAYYLIVGGAALCAGLIVFTTLQIGSLAFKGTALLWKEKHAQGLNHQQTARLLLSRLGVRLLSIAGWAVYSSFFVSSLVRVAIIINQTGMQYLHDGNGLGLVLCLGSILFFCLTLHMHVVFARLAFLRPRLFGGDHAIEVAEAR